jgi:hypothetical protein
LQLKDEKLTNKPSKNSSSVPLTLSSGKALAKIDVLKNYRGDLVSVARTRYLKTASDLRAKKGYSKKVVKSTSRGKKL